MNSKRKFIAHYSEGLIGNSDVVMNIRFHGVYCLKFSVGNTLKNFLGTS